MALVLLRTFYIFQLVSACVAFVAFLIGVLIGVVIVNNIFFTIYVIVAGVIVMFITYRSVMKITNNAILRQDNVRGKPVKQKERKSRMSATLHCLLVSLGVALGPIFTRFLIETDNVFIGICIFFIGLYLIVAFWLAVHSVQLCMLIRYKLTFLKISISTVDRL